MSQYEEKKSFDFAAEVSQSLDSSQFKPFFFPKTMRAAFLPGQPCLVGEKEAKRSSYLMILEGPVRNQA